VKDEKKVKKTPKRKKQCDKKTIAGWGAMKFCMFDEGHSGPHSWSVTG
jgi:hypothetical protein